MDAAAAAAPITREGAPLITVNPIALVTCQSASLESLFAVAITAGTGIAAGTGTGIAAAGGLRVFVGSADGEMAELTAEGRLVRRFRIERFRGAVDSVAVADRRLFALSETSIAAITIADIPDRQLSAWQQLGSPPPRGGDLPASPWSVQVVDGLLLLALPRATYIDIAPLAPPFV
jgi:hypothetical protein